MRIKAGKTYLYLQQKREYEKRQMNGGLQTLTDDKDIQKMADDEE